jgi:hypothetical protein
MSDFAPILIKECIAEEQRLSIVNYLASQEPEWHFMKTAAYSEDAPSTSGELANLNEDSFNTHAFMEGIVSKEVLIRPDLISLIFPLLILDCFAGYNLLSAQFVMTLYQKNARRYGGIHSDADVCDKMTAIYYPMTSDGDTFLFKEKQGFIGKVTEDIRVTPTANTMLLFEGQTLHAGNTPLTDTPRIILNLNFRRCV